MMPANACGRASERQLDERLAVYIQAAMQRARFHYHSGGTYYGVIPGFPPGDGVWATGSTFTACYDTLQATLQRKAETMLAEDRAHRLPTIRGLRPDDAA